MRSYGFFYAGNVVCRVKASFTVFFLLVFIVAIVVGWEWPNIARIMPIYVAALPGVVLVIVQLYRDATDWERRAGRTSAGIDMDQVSDVQLDRKTELNRTVVFFGWFAGGAIGIWLLGLVTALPLLVFLYVLIEGKEKVVRRSDRRSLHVFACVGAI